MSLPPQLIGIKRRRHDEPVELLYLEQDRSSNKRRFTDFVFQRLKPKEPEQPLSHPQPRHQAQIQDRARSASSRTTRGAPVVQATSPGAEVRHVLQRRALRAQLLERQKQNFSSESDTIAALVQSDQSCQEDAGPAKAKRPPAARRFHLSTTHFTPASSKRSGGMRKHKHYHRSRLATFVETHTVRSSDDESHVFDQKPAVDRLIDDTAFNPHLSLGRHDPALDHTAEPSSPGADYSPREIQTFVKSPAKLAKTGTSIRDHPSTWDHDSDQLANELAAFAMDIDIRDNAGNGNDHQVQVPGRRSPDLRDDDMDKDDTYVYETYFRVPQTELSTVYDKQTDSIGMLVIEEHDEELWQTFAEEEEDSEWDEEDGDSNAEDNPRNDYPEDEVSSEDEFGQGAYKHRHAAWDEEEYDVEDRPSSDDESIGL